MRWSACRCSICLFIHWIIIFHQNAIHLRWGPRNMDEAVDSRLLLSSQIVSRKGFIWPVVPWVLRLACSSRGTSQAPSAPCCLRPGPSRAGVGMGSGQMPVAALVASDDTCTAVRRDEDRKLTLSGITPRPTAADGWWHHPGRLFSSRAVGSGVEVLISWGLPHVSRISWYFLSEGHTQGRVLPFSLIMSFGDCLGRVAPFPECLRRVGVFYLRGHGQCEVVQGSRFQPIKRLDFFSNRSLDTR